MSQVTAKKTEMPAGGGAFILPSLSLGIFLNAQPSHRFAFNGGRLTDHPLAPHQGWILPKNSDGICEYDSPLDLIWVSIDDAILGESDLPADFPFEAIIGNIDPLILHLALNASAEGKPTPTLYRQSIERALAAQIIQIINPTPDWLGFIDDRRLRRVIEYIHDNLGGDLTLTQMASLAGMSATHFAKAFKKQTGSSPLHYVLNQRLDSALVLLRTSPLTIAEIAWRVGYSDLSRFGQHFKRKFGTTPKAIRAS